MSNTDSRTLIIQRAFNAPINLVWDAWTQAEQIALWWGPKGMQTKVIQHDFKVGGSWKYVMTMPDGSRGNIIYSSAISKKGPSMTIRRFNETPISIAQLIKWGTLSSGIAAYLWICLQNGR